MRSPITATKSSPCSPQLEKACAQQQRPNTAKSKNKFILKIKKINQSQKDKYCMIVLIYKIPREVKFTEK